MTELDIVFDILKDLYKNINITQLNYNIDMDLFKRAVNTINIRHLKSGKLVYKNDVLVIEGELVLSKSGEIIATASDE
jgi:predicted transcriptional regulator